MGFVGFVGFVAYGHLHAHDLAVPVVSVSCLVMLSAQLELVVSERLRHFFF